MVNSVVVTILHSSGREIMDVELPCNIIIQDLKKQFIEIPELSFGYKKIHLYFQGKELFDFTSLSENEVWDGSYITIEAEV